ncbi:hypothetical protein KIN20_020516 [Parelaphostrongylus tenuis]|uniref:Uncharacterized protein n=1 Tax=Parelaphostrongylus tenuis TaxID=148309 RepID=A0AAD5QTJ8_PARTN|nr:hypothetical protein KIN20_020516 [Parelaphostrongylus tenuis]
MLNYPKMATLQIFNVFGTSHAQLMGCDGLIFNGTTEENCQIIDSRCNETILKYEFYSANIEFGELCSRGRETWLGRILSTFEIESKARFSTTTQMFGLVVGSAIFGQLSDLHGRRKVVTIVDIRKKIYIRKSQKKAL